MSNYSPLRVPSCLRVLKGLRVISGVLRAVKTMNEEKMTKGGLGRNALVFFPAWFNPVSRWTAKA